VAPTVGAIIVFGREEGDAVLPTMNAEFSRSVRRDATSGICVANKTSNSPATTLLAGSYLSPVRA